MKLYEQFRLYAPDGTEGSASTDAPPQEEKDKSQAASEDDKSQQQEPPEKPDKEQLPEFMIQDEEGNFVIQTENSVYKGKTQQEALKAFYEGKKADEAFIRQLKAKESVKLPEGIKDKAVKREDEDGESDLVLRTREEIAQEIAPKIIKQYKIDSKKLNWTNQQWREYAVDNGLESWEISEERQDIRDVRKEIENSVERIYAEETKRMAIAEVIDEEHEQVVAAVAESGIDPAQFDYEAVLAKVVGDKNNYGRHGTLKSGRIVAEALRAIRAIEKDNGKSAYQRKLEEDMAKGKKVKRSVPDAGSGGGEYKSKPKAYDSFDDAFEDAKRELIG